jgi:hypothetical protein
MRAIVLSLLVIDAMVLGLTWLTGDLAANWVVIVSSLAMPFVLFFSVIGSLYLFVWFGSNYDPRSTARRY